MFASAPAVTRPALVLGCRVPLQVLNTVIPYPTAFRRVTREYVRRMEGAWGALGGTFLFLTLKAPPRCWAVLAWLRCSLTLAVQPPLLVLRAVC